MPSDEIRDGQRYNQGLPEWKWNELENERYKKENPVESPDGIVLLLIGLLLAAFMVLSYVFKGVGTFLTFIKYQTLEHWFLAGIIFSILFYNALFRRYNLIIKVIFTLFTFNFLFLSYSGYVMTGFFENWVGKYVLIEKKIDPLDPNLSLKQKRKLLKTGQTSFGIEKSKSIRILENNRISFDYIQKDFLVKPYDYPNHFDMIFEKEENKVVELLCNLIDENSNFKKLYFSKKGDYIKINFYDEKLNYSGIFKKE